RRPKDESKQVLLILIVQVIYLSIGSTMDQPDSLRPVLREILDGDHLKIYIRFSFMQCVITHLHSFLSLSNRIQKAYHSRFGTILI
ncbi:MAG: hypothetical protein V2A69_03885, partial [Pseudomonadota bacterium]